MVAYATSLPNYPRVVGPFTPARIEELLEGQRVSISVYELLLAQLPECSPNFQRTEGKLLNARINYCHGMVVQLLLLQNALPDEPEKT